MLKYLLYLSIFVFAACGQSGDTGEEELAETEESPTSPCTPIPGPAGVKGEPGKSTKGDTGIAGKDGMDGADGTSCDILYRQVAEKKQCNVFIKCGEKEQYLRKVRKYCEEMGVEYD